MKQIADLEAQLGVDFKNKDLLRSALVHRSYLNEHKSFGLDHNERLEFLGDAVIELVVTEYLYIHFENPEGELTNWRSSLVNYKMLAAKAEELDLYPLMHLSHGEAKDPSSKARRYIMANAYEAVIGALYLDQGLPASEKFIQQHLMPELQPILEQKLYMDPKSKFQEHAQELLNVTPRYKILKQEGPDHNKWFTVGVYLDGDMIATGEGSSKQEAETQAAAAGLTVKDWNES